jgi:hypothetical protein
MPESVGGTSVGVRAAPGAGRVPIGPRIALPVFGLRSGCCSLLPGASENTEPRGRFSLRSGENSHVRSRDLERHRCRRHRLCTSICRRCHRGRSDCGRRRKSGCGGARNRRRRRFSTGPCRASLFGGRSRRRIRPSPPGHDSGAQEEPHGSEFEAFFRARKITRPKETKPRAKARRARGTITIRALRETKSKRPDRILFARA